MSTGYSGSAAAPDDLLTGMRFRVLGLPEVFDEARQRSVRLSSPKQRILLGALLVRPGSLVSAERLIQELWTGRPPSKSANALQAHVSRLRHLLIELEPERAGSPRLLAHGDGYLLRARPEETDSWQFCQAAARARKLAATDPLAACTLLRRALRLWRGAAFEACTPGPICAAEAARLTECRMSALEILYDAALRADLHGQVVGELERLTIEHPARKSFYDLLTLALHRCGRHAEALEVHERARLRPAGRSRTPVTSGALVRPDELGNLRMLVNDIVSEQESLRLKIDRLMAQLPRRGPRVNNVYR